MIERLETTDVIYGGWIPYNLINEEYDNSSSIFTEFTEIRTYYGAYNEGAEFSIISGKNYEPPMLAYRKIKALIDKEARFLFSKSPDFTVKSVLDDNINDNLEAISLLQKLIDQVLQDNSVKNNLTQAARDCFIGKRIAIMCNFNAEGVQINLIPSLNFVYTTDKYGKLIKIVGYFMLRDSVVSKDKRVYRKKYWMQDGYCWVEETEHDGNGKNGDGNGRVRHGCVKSV